MYISGKTWDFYRIYCRAQHDNKYQLDADTRRVEASNLFRGRVEATAETSPLNNI